MVVQAEVKGGGEAEGGLDALELGVEGVLWRDDRVELKEEKACGERERERERERED